MDFDQFCSARVITEKEILDAVSTHVGLTPSEILYVSGSLLERFGNLRSDIDLYLITDRSVSAPHFHGTILVPFSKCVIDLEVWPPHLAEQSISEASEYASGIQDPRNSLKFRYRDLAFLHRLGVGRPLANHQAFVSMAQRLDRSALSRILFDQATALIGSLTIDIAGSLLDDDLPTASVSAQRVLGLAIDAMLAVKGNTNPSQKWRLRRLKGIDQSPWHYPFSPRLMASTVRDIFMRLYFGDGHPYTPEYIHECLSIARHIVPWGQLLLASRGEQAIAAISSESLPSEGPSEKDGAFLRPLAADVVLRWTPDGFVLSRLDGTIEIVVTSLTALTLRSFDGLTTINDAVRHLTTATSAPLSEISAAVNDVSLMLSHFGMLTLETGDVYATTDA